MREIKIMDCKEKYFIAIPALPSSECDDDSVVIKHF